MRVLALSLEEQELERVLVAVLVLVPLASWLVVVE
jgi:hypothetical protein